jgi:type II secretory pathway pseudopilin PulG
MSPTRSIRRGITMIELIVVIGLLLFLAALLLPAVAKVRQAAGRTQSINNLKQIGLAIHGYNDTFQRLPPTVGMANNKEGSLLFHLLPFIEQAAVYQQTKASSWEVANTVIPLFSDPQDLSVAESKFEKHVATTNYAGNWLAFKDGNNVIPNSFPDGTSNTLVFTTRYQICNGTPTAWAYPSISPSAPMFAYYSYAKFQISPKQNECDPHVPQTIGPTMAVGMCDGSVRVVAETISPRTWYLLTDPADGQAIDNDF